MLHSTSKPILASCALSIFLLLTGCGSDVSPQERERRCIQELRQFHKMEICDFVVSYRRNQLSNPTVEMVVERANIRANTAKDFYPWRYCTGYRGINSNDVLSLAPEC